MCSCEGCRGDDRLTNTKSNYIFMCVHVKVVEGMIGLLRLKSNCIFMCPCEGCRGDDSPINTKHVHTSYSYFFFWRDACQKAHRSNIS